MIYSFEQKFPQISRGVRLAKSADLVGDLTLKENVSVWYGAVIRADNASIGIGENSNVQDNAVIHVEPTHSTQIGKNVSVGHGAIVHGCTVEDDCVIGMGAILLNGCVIGAGSLVAAGALVTQNKVIPPGSLVVGSPAKVLRPLTGQELEGNRHSAVHYGNLARAELPLAEEAFS